MPGIFIGNTIVNGRGGISWPTYWASLISATVEDAAPTYVVLTFPAANPTLVATDFTIAGFTISSASWTGAVLTLVLSTAVMPYDSLVVTFVKTGETAAVTNNVSWVTYWSTRTPSDLALTVISDTQISGSFTINGTGQDGHKVYISTDGVTYSLQETLIGSDNTFAATGLTNGLTYYFKVCAYKGVNLSGYCTPVVETISTLLNNLAFSLKWNGSQFINAVTGLAMVNHGSVAVGSAVVANSALPGVFVTANSKYLSTPDTPALSVGNIDFMVAVWCNITDTSVAQNLAAQYLSAGDQRSWSIAISGTNVYFQFTSDGTGGTYDSVQGASLGNGINYFILAWHDSVANTVNIQVDNGTVFSKAWTTGIKDSSGDFTVGAIANPSGYAGGKISVDFWKRILNTGERTSLWNGGTGSCHPFNVFPLIDANGNYTFDNVNEIILMGDKNNGDAVVTPAVNTVLMAQSPDMIMGVGDYTGPVLTTAQLCANLTGYMFSSPGNHDDWTVGVRTGFNAYFRGGGYKRVRIPYVDFFIYDYYLKMDESGYYTLAEAEAITLGARQASTQGLWLIAQLAASTAKWKIVVCHNPPWASPSDYVTPGVVNQATNMRWDWVGLGADLLLSGHFHFTERLLKATGSGNLPLIIVGPSGVGSADLGWTSVDAGSQFIVNGITDTDFNGAHLLKMTVSATQLIIDVSGINSSYNIHTGKDQLILT